MQTIVLFHNSKWYSPIWTLLFVLSLILLWVNKKKWKNGYDTYFWLAILSLAIIYCPLFANVLVPKFLPSFAEYERLSWIFFEIPLISYVIVMISTVLSKKKDSYLFIIACLIVFIFVGSPDNRSFYCKSQNRYKISQDAVTICDEIDDISPKSHACLCVQMNSMKHDLSGNDIDGNLYYGIRMYQSKFQLLYHIVDPQLYQQDSFVLANELPAEIDYYICPKSEKLYQELERLGFCYINESDNYAIFQNQKKRRK